MRRRAGSAILDGEPRPLRPVADRQDGDEALVHQPELDRISISARDGASNLTSADPWVDERIQADAPDRHLNVRSDVVGRFGVGRIMVSTDPGDARDRFGAVPDLHGPKAAKAASTSSSVAYTPASDCARPRSIEARSSSLSVSQIEGSAIGEPSGASRVAQRFRRRLRMGRVHAIQNSTPPPPPPDMTQAVICTHLTIPISRESLHP